MKSSKRELFSHYLDLFVLFVEIDIFIWILFELGHSFRPFVYDVGRIMLFVLVFELSLQFLLHPSPKQYIRRYWWSCIVLALLGYVYYRFSSVPAGHRSFFLYSRLFLAALEFLLFTKFIFQLGRMREILGSFRVNPAQLIIASFAAIILIGSFLLYLPYSRAGGRAMRYIDALFTSTSAVCVTGLIVVDTGLHFSRFGQIFLLILIQAGGLGIMTIAAFIQVSLGSAMSLYGRFSTATILDQGNLRNLYAIIKSIVSITLMIEIAALCMLFPFFRSQLENLWDALFFSLFHAVSAFCNAGFSLYTESFMGARSSLHLNGVLILVIILGGLGFTVLWNLGRKLFTAKRERVSVQTRIVLLTTLFFILFGAVSFYLFEQKNSLKNLSYWERIMASLFQSVTTRTAGFNTLEISALRPITLFMMSILMFIGASPGSTGGGIKTTTFFILLLSIITILKDERFNVIFRRRIPYQVVNRAFAILVSAMVLIVFATLLLGSIEKFSFIQLYFEAVSAFGTVGLSTGITPSLTDFGKIVIMVCMFVGRLGPLTIVLAIRNVQRTKLVSFPEERVMVG